MSAVERQVCWTLWEDPGLEHLRLTEADGGVLADGVIIGCDDDGQPFRAHYQTRCDAAWRVRADGDGAWTDGAGAALPALAGCIDIDLAISPFTNTLPIRRLAFAEGKARVLTMAYIRAPELTVTPMRQRYTRLAIDRYRYENVDSDFTADLPLDAVSPASGVPPNVLTIPNAIAASGGPNIDPTADRKRYFIAIVRRAAHERGGAGVLDHRGRKSRALTA